MLLTVLFRLPSPTLLSVFLNIAVGGFMLGILLSRFFSNSLGDFLLALIAGVILLCITALQNQTPLPMLGVLIAGWMLGVILSYLVTRSKKTETVSAE